MCRKAFIFRLCRVFDDAVVVGACDFDSRKNALRLFYDVGQLGKDSLFSLSLAAAAELALVAVVSVVAVVGASAGVSFFGRRRLCYCCQFDCGRMFCCCCRFSPGPSSTHAVSGCVCLVFLRVVVHILYGHGLEEYRRGRMCGRGGYEMERKPTSLTFGSMAEEN